MKIKLQNLTLYSLLGATWGGVMAGLDYEHLSYIVLALFNVAMFDMCKNFIHDGKHRLLFVILLGAYSVFTFQVVTIAITGATEYPIVWWIYHPLIIVYAVMVTRETFNQ